MKKFALACITALAMGLTTEDAQKKPDNVDVGITKALVFN